MLNRRYAWLGVVVGVGLVILPSSAQATFFGIRALGGVNYSIPVGNSGASGELGFNFGGGLEVGFNRIMAASLDVFWHRRGARYGGFSTGSEHLTIPAMFELLPAPWISLGLGPYMAASLSGASGVEAGVTANVAFRIRVSRNFSILLDSRMFYGLTNPTALGGYNTVDFAWLAGLQFSLPWD